MDCEQGRRHDFAMGGPRTRKGGADDARNVGSLKPPTPPEPRVLAAARVLAGLTQQELAGASGVALNVIRRYEKGVGNPRPSSVAAVVEALRLKNVTFLPTGEGYHVAVGLIAPPEM